MTAATHAAAPPFADTFRPRVHADVIVDRVGDDGVILLHPAEARWALTSAAGLEITRRFDGLASIGEIAGALAAEFDGAEIAEVRGDLLEFTKRLYESNLLENAPLPAGATPGKPLAPPSMTIYVTEQCNLRCKHCAIVQGKMPETTLETDDIRRIIDEHTALNPGATVSFLGGEPLMRPDCLDLLEHAASRTPSVNLGTNALYIDDAVAARLARLGISIQVSVDGADPAVHDQIRGKGTFTKTWDAIGRLCAHGAAKRVTISATLTRCLLPQVRDLIARVDALGLQKPRLIPLNKIKAAATNWESLEPEPSEMKAIIRWVLFDLPGTDRSGLPEVTAGFPGFVPKADPNGQPWCPLGRTFIIDSQGETYNCPAHGEKPQSLGSIHNAPLATIQGGEANRRAREEMLQRRFRVPECRACAWRNFCQGGCQAFMYHRTGIWDVNDEFCDFRRELYREHARRKGAQALDGVYGEDD